jgi:hypothetical protein
MTMPYPVIAEHTLERLSRKIFVRREPSELPQPRPHSVYVFSSGDTWETVPPQHFKGNENYVLAATFVWLVDMTQNRGITAECRLPSSWASDEFELKATFSCSVTSAEKLVRQGEIDLPYTLQSYLQEDQQLRRLAARFSVENIAELREHLHARIRARAELRPPRIEGMDVRLSDVEVSTPQRLKSLHEKLVSGADQHAVTMRTRNQERELQEYERSYIEQLQRQDEIARAAAVVASGQMSQRELLEQRQNESLRREQEENAAIERMAEQRRQDRQQEKLWDREDAVAARDDLRLEKAKRYDAMVEMIKVWSEHGITEEMPDAGALVDRLVDGIIGPEDPALSAKRLEGKKRIDLTDERPAREDAATRRSRRPASAERPDLDPVDPDDY